MTIKDYSSIENFNLAAVEAFQQTRKDHETKQGKPTDKGEVIYNYKGRKLKVSYDAFLDDNGGLDYVGITSVDLVEGD